MSVIMVSAIAAAMVIVIRKDGARPAIVTAPPTRAAALDRRPVQHRQRGPAANSAAGIRRSGRVGHRHNANPHRQPPLR
jgi:hypothetical protein